MRWVAASVVVDLILFFALHWLFVETHPIPYWLFVVAIVTLFSVINLALGIWFEKKGWYSK